MAKQKTNPEQPPKPEHFIPYLRQDLIQMCLDDGRLTPEEQEQFRDFCEILTSYFHYQYHVQQEKIKYHYAPFDPDRETKLDHLTPAQLVEYNQRVFDSFRLLARDANFQELGEADLEQAFRDKSLIQLEMRVDIEDFDSFACFARGDSVQKAVVPKLFGKKEVEVRAWQRVMLLLKFKPLEYFQSRKNKRKWLENSNFNPGRMYAYFFKDVPKLDLELLFPNVEVRMTWKDKLMLCVPAIGGGIGVILKSASSIALIVAAVLVYFGLKERPDDQSLADGMAVLTALLMVVIAFGALAFKQWNSYRGKRIQFLKDVSENLFFRSLATNQSVFFRLIDNAEEEEAKEAILVFYHLLVNRDRQFTAEQLDVEIEHWFRKRFEAEVDFEIDDPIDDLQKVVGRNSRGLEVPLLSVDANGHIHCLPLSEAKTVLDYLWDNAYDFNKARQEEALVPAG